MKKKILMTTMLLGMLLFGGNMAQASPHHGPKGPHMHRPPMHQAHMHRPPMHHHIHHPRHSIYYSPYYYSTYYPGVNFVFSNGRYIRNHGHLGATFHISL